LFGIREIGSDIELRRAKIKGRAAAPASMCGERLDMQAI